MTPPAQSPTLAPHPGAAGLFARVFAQLWLELKLLMRNGEQFVLAVVIPLLILVGVARTSFIDVGSDDRLDTVVPGVMALAVLSTAFTAQAIATGFDRRYGVLRLLGATPLGRNGLILGKIGAICVIVTGQLTVITIVGVALGWRPNGDPLWVVLLAALGVAAFTGLALLLAGTLRAEATLALANLVFVLLLFAGGLIVPVSEFPDAVQPLMRCLPTAALADGLRTVFTDGAAPGVGPVLVLTIWSVVSIAAVSRWFKWD